jgi:D-alanyl-D-alanine carboxypeptidase
MVASRSRRSRIRRGTVTVLVVTVAATVSMTMAPVLASHRALGAPTLNGQVRLGALAHEPESIHTPAPVERIPSYAPIGVRPWAPDGPAATVATRMALKKRLERLRAKYAIPGVSVAILFPDGGMWVGASGSADIAGKVPVTPATAFAIASISKTFTSALILALWDEDRLDLDASARTYLPDLRIDPKITVRQLLDHTSGLRDYFFHPLIDPVLREHPTRDWNEAEAMRYVGKPYFKPGRGWHYSNTNYLVLGLLAEAVGGAPLAEQLRTRFAEPLGLSATYYQPDETPTGPVAHGYRFASTSTEAKAVDLSDGTSVVPFTSVVTAAAGAGGMASSASDLARWARALYAGNVLSPETAQEMLDDVARTRPFKPTVPYGLGVQVVTIDGDVTLGHSGRLLGFRSAMRWLPEEGVAIAVLTNQSRTDPGIIVKALLKIALKPTANAPAWPGRHRPEPEFAR